MKKYAKTIVRSTLAATAAAVIFCGCESTEEATLRIDKFDYTTVVNNHLNLRNFVDHLVACGIKVDEVQQLNPHAVKAIEAASVTIDGKDIGVYRFDIDVNRQRELLKKYHERGFVYIMGFRYPVFISGSYLLLGAERHPRKLEIIEALRSFK